MQIILKQTIHVKYQGLLCFLKQGNNLKMYARPLEIKVSSVIKYYFFPISQSKHMLWVLKRTVSMRRFFRAPKTNVKTVG